MEGYLRPDGLDDGKERFYGPFENQSQKECCKTDLYTSNINWDIVGSIPDPHNKTNIAIRWVTQIF